MGIEIASLMAALLSDGSVDAASIGFEFRRSDPFLNLSEVAHFCCFFDSYELADCLGVEPREPTEVSAVSC